MSDIINEDIGLGQMENEKPEGEKTNFAIQLVCEKRLLNKTIKTEIMDEPTIRYLVGNISKGFAATIPLDRRVKIQSAEYCRDSFEVTQNLAESMDYIYWGIYEGFEVK